MMLHRQQKGARSIAQPDVKFSKARKGLVIFQLVLLLQQAAALTSPLHLSSQTIISSESHLARSLLQSAGVPIPAPPASINSSTATTNSSRSSNKKTGHGFSAFIATTIAASTGAIGVVSGVAGVAAANLGAGTVIQAAGALNMQATSAAVVQMIQHVQVFASMDAPVQQLATNGSNRDSFTKNITDALSWITFSTRHARCKTGHPGQPPPNAWEQSRCLWRSGKNHVVVIAIVLGVTMAIHALLVLVWNFTIGFIKPMPVVLVPPNIELMLAGIFVLPLAAAATQLIAADTWQSITLASFVIAALGLYCLFLMYVLLGIIAQKKRYGLVYKRTKRNPDGGQTPGQDGTHPGDNSSGTKGLPRSASARRGFCMNINWPQWHGVWEVLDVPEDQRATYRKQYVRTSRWYGFLSRLHQRHSSTEDAKLVSVEMEDRLGGLHDPYRGDNILAYNWELVKLGYLVAQGVLLAATEATLEVGAMSWSLLWLQVAYAGLMTLIRPYRNQWLGFLDVAANWVRVGTYIVFIQLANKDKSLQKNLLSRLELTSMALVLLSAWVHVLSMFIKVEGIYFAVRKPKFLTWAHKSIKHTMPFTAQHIDRVEATAAEVERVRSGRLPDVMIDSSPLLATGTTTGGKNLHQEQKSSARVSKPVVQLPKVPEAATPLLQPVDGKQQTEGAGEQKRMSSQQQKQQQQSQQLEQQSQQHQRPQQQQAATKPAPSVASAEQVQVQVPSGATTQTAAGQPAVSHKQPQQKQVPGQSQRPGIDSATALNLPKVSHLPDVRRPAMERHDEHEDEAEQIQMPVALTISDDGPTHLRAKNKPVLDRPPSPEASGQLVEGGLQVGPHHGKADSPGESSGKPTASAASADTTKQVLVSSSQPEQSPGQNLSQTPGPSPSQGPGQTPTTAVPAAVGAAGENYFQRTGAGSQPPSSLLGQGLTPGSDQETRSAVQQIPAPYLAELRPLGAAAHQQASLQSQGADVFHSIESEFSTDYRRPTAEMEWDAGLGLQPAAGQPVVQTPAAEGTSFEDTVVDEILKGLLMEIMCSRPNSMSSTGPLAAIPDTAGEDVEEALQRVLGQMHAAQESRDIEDSLNVELLRARLLHLHQDLLVSWQQEPSSPFRPLSPTSPLISPSAMQSLKHAYSTRPQASTTPTRPVSVLRYSQSMPAAVGRHALPFDITQPPTAPTQMEQASTTAPEIQLGHFTAQFGTQPNFRRSKTDFGHHSGADPTVYRHSHTMPAAVASAAAEPVPFRRSQTNVGHYANTSQVAYRQSQSLPAGVASAAAAAAAMVSSPPEPMLPTIPAVATEQLAATKELRRSRTYEPSRTSPASSSLSLQYNHTMPAGVGAAAAAAADAVPSFSTAPGFKSESPHTDMVTHLDPVAASSWQTQVSTIAAATTPPALEQLRQQQQQ